MPYGQPSGMVGRATVTTTASANCGGIPTSSGSALHLRIFHMTTMDRVEHTLIRYGPGRIRPAAEDASGYVVEPARGSVVAIRWQPAMDCIGNDSGRRHLQRCAAILSDNGFRDRETFGTGDFHFDVALAGALQ